MSLHILRPRGHYIGQARRVGCRRWSTITGRCRTAQGALALLAKEATRGNKALRVLFVDSSPYYEPHPVFEGRWS